MRNTLFLNRGDGTYSEIAQLSGVDASEWSWMPMFLDVDLDGYEDLLVASGLERGYHRQRIDDKSGDDVELHFRPQRAIGVHGRHQPIKAIVTLHCNTKRSGVPLRQAGYIPPCLGHLGQHGAGQGEQTLADGGEAQRLVGVPRQGD
jgi:hypothetical protein